MRRKNKFAFLVLLCKIKSSGAKLSQSPILVMSHTLFHLLLLCIMIPLPPLSLPLIPLPPSPPPSTFLSCCMIWHLGYFIIFILSWKIIILRKQNKINILTITWEMFIYIFYTEEVDLFPVVLLLNLVGFNPLFINH